MEQHADPARDLLLLEHIETDPDVTQASLAGQLGVAVGTVNWHLKRLISKGYVKVTRAQRRKLRYIITPQGLSLRARLTVDYVEQSMALYRRTRSRVQTLLAEARAAGVSSVCIEVAPGSPDDILDICKLTCMEQGMPVEPVRPDAATLRITGHKVHLIMENNIVEKPA
ncbi:MAG: winged helix-turn-helix transcriptional regulator [Anaerolineales bacterium]|nr:MAG: winged helix-turn-helix transcriptional regulator [Anaerolineales bacterium]